MVRREIGPAGPYTARRRASPGGAAQDVARRAREHGGPKSFDKIRNDFGVNAIALAGALASVGDPGHVDSVVAKVKTARERIGTIARANSLVPLPSATNS